MRLGLMVAVLALGGCMSLTRQGYLGATVDPADYAAVTAQIEREADPHKRITNIRAPAAYYRADADMSDGSYFLRASRAPDGRLARLQLYIDAVFVGWAFVDRAWSHGERLDLTAISREVGGYYGGMASVHEHVAINLTPGQLTAYADRGLSVKIEGDRGSAVVNVPAPYFRAFRDALQ